MSSISSLKALVNFPRDFPIITSALMLKDGSTILTGHENGLIVRSNLLTGKFDVIDDCHFEVTALTISRKGDVIVGCHSGLLYTFNVDKPEEKQTIQDPGFGKRDRVWRLVWINDSTFVEGSNYGVLSAFSRNAHGQWAVSSLTGHSDALFGLDTNGSMLASGDYRGNILLWKIKDSNFALVDRIRIGTGVQGIDWQSDKLFAAVDRIGRVHVFETQETDQWRSVYQTDTATSLGSSIHIPEGGSSVYAGTQTELIQFDLESQRMEQYSISNVKAIFSDKSDVLVVTDREILSLAKKIVSIPAQFAKYKFSKISLIGHTGVGKSTLASNFVKRSAEGIESTFGRRLWVKDLPADDLNPPRKIILHDHGGQESVLGTYLPFLTDSDIILLVFQKTDFDTFEDALRSLDELTEIASKRTKIFLVQTFSDSKMADINLNRIAELTESGRIVDFLTVDARDVNQVDSLFSRIMKEISWETERIMIESPFADGILRTVSRLYDEQSTVVPLDHVHDTFKTVMGFDVSTPHLKFLLRNLGSQGFVEYYPEILDSLILNDEQYNKLRTEIPIFVRNHQGIVKADSILQGFKPAEYAAMIDQLFMAYGIALANDGLRLFPTQLKAGSVVITEKYRLLLKGIAPLKRTYRAQPVRPERILGSLTDLKLRCVDASQRGGLFAWEENACVYYSFSHVTDDVSGDSLQFNYYVGGNQAKVRDRLASDFPQLIDRLFGPPLELEDLPKKLVRATSMM